MTPPDDRLVRRTELAISLILRVGVLASLALVVFGTVLSFVHHPEYPSEGLSAVPQDFPHTIGVLLAEALAFRGRAWVGLGLLVLIATPIVRVAASILAFAFQRDRVYVVLTSVVLAILVTAMVLGRVAA